MVHELRGLDVYLEVIPDDDYATSRIVKHYIYVKTYDSKDILISISEDEYDLLDPMLIDIEDKMRHKYY
jgi:hypothetical protein